MSTDNRLDFIRIAGSPHDIGVQLGRFGRRIAHDYLLASSSWNSVMAFRGDPRMLMMRDMVEQRFPAYWSELQGLARGLDLPLDEVFLWNCRGDVWAMTQDGCTTVQIPGEEPILAHNEDGDPGFRGHCALAQVRPEDGVAFTSFVYPASLPGHTFAVTEAGLVQTVNNIRSRDAGLGLPRMVLGRAILDCRSVDEAIRLIEGSERAGSFHMTLGQQGDARLLGIEFTHRSCSVRAIDRPHCHANHLIHADMQDEPQFVTGSSGARQQRGDTLLADTLDASPNPLGILWDVGVPRLPIYRAHPHDPDAENTLATAVFRIGSKSIDWEVYDGRGGLPRFSLEGTSTPARG